MGEDKFRRELFTEPEEYEETPLRDRKAILPNLRHNEEKAEFIRDVIALANTARMLGKPAYLLYGISRQGELCGIGDSRQYYDDLTDPSLAERIRHRLRELLTRHVSPHVNLDIRTGRCEDKEVAYIKIEPMTPPTVFQVREDLVTRHQRLLNSGQCWIRFGESKSEVDRREIAPNSDPYCYAYSEVPFVMPSVWRRYLEGLLDDREADLVAAEDIPSCQTLFDVSGEPADFRLQQFLEREDRLLVICGTACCGKTVLLRRLVAGLVRNGLEAVRVRERDEDYRPPACWIPVYFPLRGTAVNSSWHLEQVLWDAINSVSRWAFWQETRPSHPEMLFRQSSLRWLVCFDGLDEIASDAGQRQFGSKLRQFLRRFGQVKVILTTRTDANTAAFQQIATTLSIAPLKHEQVFSYLRNFVDEDDQALEELAALLEVEPELWNLLRVPGYLVVALRKLSDVYPSTTEVVPAFASVGEMPLATEAGRNVSDLLAGTAAVADDLTLASTVTNETPEQEVEQETVPIRAPLTLGWLLDEIFREAWKREDLRHGEDETCAAEWWDAVGKLALDIDGRRRDVDAREVGRHLRARRASLLRRVLSLGILVRDRYLAPLRFGTEVTKTYFAATWVERLLRCDAHGRAQRALSSATPEFRTRTLEILQSVTAISLEPLMDGGEP